MSAMKPDGYLNLGGLLSDNVAVYSLATVRKWLEEEPSEAVRDAFYLACDVEFQSGSLADGFRAMLAANLRELEGGE